MDLFNLRYNKQSIKLKTHPMKNFIFIFIFIFFIQNSYSQQNTNGWYWINSQPQSNNLNWVKIIDANHIYAVGENGTFMKSSDGGDSWRINTQAGITEELFGSGGSNRLYSAWFFDANTGIVVGQSNFDDGGKIKRTTDAGETFSTIGLGLPSGLARTTDIYFLNSATGYICGNSTVGVLKTTNSGLNWTQITNLPDPTFNYLCVYMKDLNNIFLGVETDGYPFSRRVVRTINGGTTWKIDTLPGTTIVNVNDILFKDANTGFLAGESNYFAYTVNGGANWTQAITPNTPEGMSQLQIVGSNVNVLGSYNSYYRTTNLGVTWDSVYFNDPTNPYQPYPFYMNSFDINGNDAIVVGYNGKINISNDAGASWRNKNYSVGNNMYTFASIYAQPGTGKVWAGGDAGLILYSSNRGTNWTVQQTSASQTFFDINMKNANTGYAAGGNLFSSVGFCYKTTNSGSNWVALPIPSPGTPVYNVDFVNETTGWISGGFPFGSPPVVAKTTNGGATWVNQSTTPVINNVMSDLDMWDANTGYCCSGTNLWKTTNGGINWNIITGPPTGTLAKITTLSSSIVYIAGNQSIGKSTNGGVNWNLVTIPSSQANIFNMDWADQVNGTVTGTSGYTAKTKDGGLTWTERNPGSSTITGVSMVGKDTVYASCDRNVSGAIFRLIDNSTAITFNIKVGIEGFWNGSVQVSDTVKCHLRSAVSPYAEVGVVAAVTNNQGNATFIFPVLTSGSYYLEMTQRNSIETWSAAPLNVTQGGTFNYDFTTSASQAFGSNMILKLGRYCDYSGDVNQSGDVNLTDLLETYNSNFNFTTGYVAPDVNGDNIVDLSDITIVYNNAIDFIAKVTP